MKSEKEVKEMLKKIEKDIKDLRERLNEPKRFDCNYTYMIVHLQTLKDQKLVLKWVLGHYKH